MEEQIKLDYFYGNEADRFCFYRIPKVLFTKAYFAGLSTDAKVLYGLMLDMMSSSRANRWIDTENRVFIQFSIQRAMAYLGCGKAKAIKLFAELDTEKGIGLIERVNRGLGKSDIIYVKSFEVPQEAEENARITQMKKHQQDLTFGPVVQKSEDMGDQLTFGPVVQKLKDMGDQLTFGPLVQKSEDMEDHSTFGPVVQKLNDYNRESGDDEVVRKPNRFQNRTGTKIELPEVCFSNPINTDYNMQRRSINHRDLNIPSWSFLF